VSVVIRTNRVFGELHANLRYLLLDSHGGSGYRSSRRG
jgi:hypothetical protein